MVSEQIKPVTVLGGLDHTHLFEYNPKTKQYDCTHAKCYAHLQDPIPKHLHVIRRGDYVVVIHDAG